MIITADTPVAEAAEYYVSLGLSPVPLYGIVDGRCTCGSSKCAPGKHPIGTGWQKAATLDLDSVRDRFREHYGNIGLYLDNKFVLIDADGDSGLDAIDELGEMPDTLCALSGSQKGAHWIYKLAPHQSPERITDRRVIKRGDGGVDVKIRGQFVAAPSVHHSGNRYTWERLCEPAMLPDHIYALIARPERPAAPPSASKSVAAERVRAWVAKAEPAVSGQGGHNKTFAVACKIVACGLTEDEEWAIFTEYNERCDPPWPDSALAHKLRQARERSTSTPLSDRPRLVSVPMDATADPDAWKIRCVFERSKSGASRMARVAENAVIILQNDPRWVGRVRLDEFAQDISLTDPPWPEHHTPGVDSAHWRDGDTSRLQAWLIREHGLNLSISDIERAVMMVAENNTHNPVKEWMDALHWDGFNRLDRWLSFYLGAVDTPYTRAVGRWWLVSAVARVYRPGCKVDHMLILYGDQGKGKSSAAGILAGQDWFADSAITIGDKDAYLALRGKLIIEMAELESLNRAESTATKSFISSRIDNYRPPYARRNIDVPRRCVFIGTTNNDEMLRDDTGDRRYWPVTCGDIDRGGLQADREQLWAEAVAAFQTGAAWYPESAEDRSLCTAAQSEHKQTHPWQAEIGKWLEDRRLDTVTVQTVLGECLRLQAAQWKDSDAKTVSGCLKRLGWTQRNDTRLGGKKQRYYVLDR